MQASKESSGALIRSNRTVNVNLTAATVLLRPLVSSCECPNDPAEIFPAFWQTAYRLAMRVRRHGEGFHRRRCRRRRRHFFGMRRRWLPSETQAATFSTTNNHCLAIGDQQSAVGRRASIAASPRVVPAAAAAAVAAAGAGIRSATTDFAPSFVVNGVRGPLPHRRPLNAVNDIGIQIRMLSWPVVRPLTVTRWIDSHLVADNSDSFFAGEAFENLPLPLLRLLQLISSHSINGNRSRSNGTERRRIVTLSHPRHSLLPDHGRDFG